VRGRLWRSVFPCSGGGIREQGVNPGEDLAGEFIDRQVGGEYQVGAGARRCEVKERVPDPGVECVGRKWPTH
jgi:hypothetical protein